MKSKIVIAAGLMLLAGAASAAPTKQEIARARFEPLPSNYEARAREFIGITLKDPYSAVYEFRPPLKGWWQDGWAAGHRKHFAWIIPVTVNAKNSYGAYAGRQFYWLAWKDGQMVSVTNMFMLKRAGFVGAR
jgi:hypothetical protein